MKKAISGIAVVFGVILALAVIVFVMVIGLKNKMVSLDEDAKTQWSQVEVQYQRRFDLIPNVVNSVKGYMSQEQKVFGDIAEARTRYSGATSANDKVNAANDLESAIGRLLVVMENYPELKSDKLVSDLIVELEGTENRISTERGRYNEVVKEFNKTIRSFPNSLINDLFLKFELREQFNAVEGSEVAPTVNLETE